MGSQIIFGFRPGKIAFFFPQYIPSHHCPDKGATMPEATHSAHRQFTIYKNGFIYTMEGDKPTTVECLVVGTPSFGGKIEYVGTLDGLPEHMSRKGTEYDLKKRTLMPGFIDPHCHPTMAGILLDTYFITPLPWSLPNDQGEVPATQTPEDYLKRLEEFVTNEIKKNNDNGENEDKFMITWGYISQFHGDVDRTTLDKICKERPIVVWQRSFHELFLNTKALDLCWNTKDGKIVDEVQGNDQVVWDKGQFFEAGLDLLFAKSDFITKARIFDTLGAGYKMMVEMVQNGGVTAIADLEFPSLDIEREGPLCQEILDKPIGDGDKSAPYFSTFAVPSMRNFSRDKPHEKAIKDIKEKSMELSKDKFIMFNNHVKFMNDGAFFSQAMQMLPDPLTGKPYTDSSDHKGAWITKPEDLAEAFDAFWKEGFQIHLHTNGDKGMENVLENVERLLKLYPDTIDTHRTTVEHAGFFNEEQAKRLGKTKCLVSAQPYYNYILADKYSSKDGGLGWKRGQKMTPVKYLVDNNVPFTLHSDLTMAPAAPLLLAWCAITRRTVSGGETSPELKISVWDGMKAVTKEAANILGQLDSMGTLTVGKLGNLTILEEDPFDAYRLAALKMEIKDIPILGTVFRGHDIKYIQKKQIRN